MSPLGRKIAIALIAFLLCVAGILSSLRLTPAPENDIKQTTPAVAIENLPVDPPPVITDSMKQVLAKSIGFAALISYTDRGFEPEDVSISKGQAIRFTNNSSRTLWIMSSGGDGGVYPASEESCGQTAFDTCKAIAPHEIWEFTFNVPGTWVYRNNTHTADVGVVRIK